MSQKRNTPPHIDDSYAKAVFKVNILLQETNAVVLSHPSAPYEYNVYI